MEYCWKMNEMLLLYKQKINDFGIIYVVEPLNIFLKLFCKYIDIKAFKDN